MSYGKARPGDYVVSSDVWFDMFRDNKNGELENYVRSFNHGLLIATNRQGGPRLALVLCGNTLGWTFVSQISKSP